MPAGPDPTTATACPVSRRGGRGVTQPLVPGAACDCALDLFDGHRIALADLQDAGSLARRGAEAAGELGKVVRRVQLDDRVLEAVVVDEVIPVRDQVPERTAVVTEGHAAVHTASALLAQFRHRPGEQKLLIVVRALGRVPLRYPWRSICKKPPSLPIRPPPAAQRARAARAYSRGASPSQTPCSPAIRPSLQARVPPPVSPCAARASSISARSSITSAGSSSSKPTMPCCSVWQSSRPRRAHTRRHRSSRREVAARRAEHDHTPTGHVLAA